MSITAMFNKLSALRNELEATKEKLEGLKSTLQRYKAIRDKEKINRFLLILNDSYLTFRSQILAMEPMPSLGRIFQLAVQEESQRLTATEHARGAETLALAARGLLAARREKERNQNREKTPKAGMWPNELRFGTPHVFKEPEMDG